MIVMAVIVFSGQADFIGQRAQLQQYDTERFGAQRAGIELAGQYPLGASGRASSSTTTRSRRTHLRCA